MFVRNANHLQILRAQFVTLLGPPLTPEPVSSPVVGKPNGWNRCHSGFFGPLESLGTSSQDDLEDFFPGFRLPSGLWDNYSSRESKPKPVFVTGCYWVGVACNIYIYIIYLYNIFIRVIDIYNVYICIYIFIYINIYIYIEEVLIAPFLLRYFCRVWTWRTMVQSFFHVKVLLAISVMISVWGPWSIWKDDRSEQEMLIDFFWAALIFRWYIHIVTKNTRHSEKTHQKDIITTCVSYPSWHFSHSSTTLGNERLLKKTWTFFQALTFGADRRESGCLKSNCTLGGLNCWLIFWSPKQVGCTTGPGLQEPRLAGGAGGFWRVFFCWCIDGFLFDRKKKLCFFWLTRGKHVENKKHEFEGWKKAG